MTMNPPEQIRIELLEARIAPAGLALLNLSTLNGSNGFKTANPAIAPRLQSNALAGRVAEFGSFGVSDNRILN